MFISDPGPVIDDRISDYEDLQHPYQFEVRSDFIKTFIRTSVVLCRCTKQCIALKKALEKAESNINFQ